MILLSFKSRFYRLVSGNEISMPTKPLLVHTVDLTVRDLYRRMLIRWPYLLYPIIAMQVTVFGWNGSNMVLKYSRISESQVNEKLNFVQWP